MSIKLAVSVGIKHEYSVGRHPSFTASVRHQLVMFLLLCSCRADVLKWLVLTHPDATCFFPSPGPAGSYTFSLGRQPAVGAVAEVLGGVRQRTELQCAIRVGPAGSDVSRPQQQQLDGEF